MFLSGLLPRPMTADDDQKLLEHGIGFTNIVERTTKGTANLTRREIEEGNKGILNVQQIVLYVFLCIFSKDESNLYCNLDFQAM